MLDQIAHKAQAKASQTAQTAVLGLGAALLLSVGLGFLTCAMWIFLAAATDTLTAAATIGAAYFGGGLILIAVMTTRRRSHKRTYAAAQANEPAKDPMHEIVLAFVTGMRAGQQSRHG
tara:strand:- start:1119 stop:1472 length:354 start_codon:yes stop_codon:yes gene_type:complete